MVLSHDFQDVKLGANVATLVLATVSTATYYVCWRWSESARVRRMTKSGRAGSSSLPSPVPVLPRWLPFVGGHTLQMKSDKLNQQLEGWADEFGGDFEVTIAGNRIVFVTGAEDVRRILLLRPSKFKRGWTAGPLRWMSKEVGLGQSLLFDESKEWGRSRRVISPSLNEHNVVKMIPTITKIAERVCAKLIDHEGEVIDFLETFERYTHDVIALTAFAIDADSVRATKDRPCVSFEAMRGITGAIMALLMNPLAMLGWVMFPSLLPWVRATKEGTQRLHHVVEGAISAMRCQLKGGGGDLADGTSGSILRKFVSVEGSGESTKGLSNRMTFSDAEILTHAKGLFLAGSETTAKTMSWAMYFLAKNPEMLSRCREEALRVAPLSDGMVSTAEQASQLVFYSAVFKETLRLWPAGTFLFLHNTEATTLKSGIEFEAGTAFTLLLRYPCLSEDAFTRAKEFIPERWIEAEREHTLLGNTSADGTSNRRVAHREEDHQAFGGGPRKCPGQNMAKLEAVIALSAICARFDLDLAPGQDDPPEETMIFTSGVKSLSLVLTRRPAQHAIQEATK
ncbi:unnamed protein product [Pylaiella littoralis]